MGRELLLKSMSTAYACARHAPVDYCQGASEQAKPIRRDHLAIYSGIPQLVVEVLLPSTEARDRVRKLRTYNRFGVQHYWLVDPEEQFMQVYALLASGDYVICRSVGENEVFTHPDYPDLSIELESLWRKGGL